MGFEYVEPRDVEEAVRIRSAVPGAYLLAGGTDLMLRVRLRQVNPRLVVGVGRLPELVGIEETAEGGLRLGAAATLGAIARSAVGREIAPLLTEVCGRTRSPQVRTLATIGGTLCAASPLAEPTPCLLALDASVRLRGAGGERTLALDDFLVGPGQTALRPDEILLSVLLEAPTPGTRTAYERLTRREAIEAPLIASAVSLTMDGKGICRSARVTLGVATPRPVRLPDVEAALAGRRLDSATVQAAAQAAGAVEVRDDVRASKEYRQRMAPVVVGRALARALGA